MDDRIARRRPAARLALCAALAAVSLGLYASDGPPAPDFALRALGGGNHRLSEHRGEVVALVFWASFCGDCRRELERFERLRKTYATAGFVVLGVNLDSKPGQAAAIASAAGIRYPVLVDADHAVSRAYDADRLPLILLIDREGVVRARHGALDERDERALLVGLRDLIDE